jgi:hypothetical protein
MLGFLRLPIKWNKKSRCSRNSHKRRKRVGEYFRTYIPSHYVGIKISLIELYEFHFRICYFKLEHRYSIIIKLKGYDESKLYL